MDLIVELKIVIERSVASSASKRNAITWSSSR